jgi:hypothetical protein
MQLVLNIQGHSAFGRPNKNEHVYVFESSMNPFIIFCGPFQRPCRWRRPVDCDTHHHERRSMRIMSADCHANPQSMT